MPQLYWFSILQCSEKNNNVCYHQSFKTLFLFNGMKNMLSLFQLCLHVLSWSMTYHVLPAAFRCHPLCCVAYSCWRVCLLSCVLGTNTVTGFGPVFFICLSFNICIIHMLHIVVISVPCPCFWQGSPSLTS